MKTLAEEGCELTMSFVGVEHPPNNAIASTKIIFFIVTPLHELNVLSLLWGQCH
jgi:hypothetical protein